MEFSSLGGLFDYIVESSKLKESEACLFFHQIIDGIEYIHKLGIVHRDLKPENLLLDINKKIKIVGFGLSINYKKDEMLQTVCGSSSYAAPEMVDGKKYEGIKVDIWSSGVILFMMVCGYLPFGGKNSAELKKKIIAGEYKIPKFLSSSLQDLIIGILNKDPNGRLTIDEIRNHPWYCQINEIVYPGIFAGHNHVPVEDQILNQLEQLKIYAEYTRKCLEANKDNEKNFASELLLKKHFRKTDKTFTYCEVKKKYKKRSLSIQFHHRGTIDDLGQHSINPSMTSEYSKTKKYSSVSPQRTFESL